MTENEKKPRRLRPRDRAREFRAKYATDPAISNTVILAVALLVALGAGLLLVFRGLF